VELLATEWAGPIRGLEGIDDFAVHVVLIMVRECTAPPVKDLKASARIADCYRLVKVNYIIYAQRTWLSNIRVPRGRPVGAKAGF
jgi:hypothetical protein